MKIVDSKCPSCNSTLNYDINNNNFKCKSCKNAYTIDELKKIKTISKAKVSFDEVICPNCGAQVFTSNNIISTKCIYCKNNVIVQKTKDKTSIPDKIIPFTISKSFAKKIVFSKLSNRKLLPKNFLNEKTLDKIEAIYIPFWLYNNDYNVKLSFFEESQISIYKKLNADVSFTLIPYDANNHLDNIITNGLEPFNYQELVNFEPVYLAGIMAQKYDVEHEVGFNEVNERCSNSIKQIIKNTRYEYYIPNIKFIDHELINNKHYYALLPIWLLKVDYNNKIYTIAVNGQTGKIACELPISNSKYIIFGILVFILIFMCITILFMIIRWVGIIC